MSSAEILDNALINGYIYENYDIYTESENYYYENYYDNNFQTPRIRPQNPQEILGQRLRQQDFAIDKFKKCVRKFVQQPEEHL